ncbi:unnamed protein product, partial [Mesorhabditis belari]|uniref:Protein kinase domain-containing protein n=1 Tax=Mesorhabditis belari TaxID=2138241 RepID=A0AAF3FA16_9BILA
MDKPMRFLLFFSFSFCLFLIARADVEVKDDPCPDLNEERRNGGDKKCEKYCLGKEIKACTLIAHLNSCYCKDGYLWLSQKNKTCITQVECDVMKEFDEADDLISAVAFINFNTSKVIQTLALKTNTKEILTRCQCARKDSGQSEKSMSENEFSFRYIKKVSGENLTLECARPIGSYVRWEYPYEGNMELEGNKIKLFVENEEWIERCTMNKKLPNPDEVKNIRAHPALNQTNHLKCIKLWENYHPSHGFFITSSEIPLKWSQVNNKKFRCEYENGSVEFFIQATKSIPGFKGGETKLNCTLFNQQLLLLDIKKGRLKLSCPSCDSNIDQTVVNQIFERFEENETLQEAITFWKSNNKSFCSCIQQIGAGGDALKTLLIFVFAFILLVAALLSLYVSFAFWIIHKRRAIGRRIKFELEEETTPLQTRVEMESLVEAQKVDQFKSPSKIAEFEQTYEERPIGVGEFGKVCELIGHNPIFVTMEFVLKIGDFGLAKYIEKTCVGSFAGTQRYMSPTRSREGDDLQASHRNDVYALGLVLWEIIERRIVFLEYGSRGSFNPYDFFADIIQKKLKRLIAPNCQKGIREIIRRCTNFNRSSRPMAVEVLEELIRFQQNDSFIDSLNVEPTEEPEQQRGSKDLPKTLYSPNLCGVNLKTNEEYLLSGTESTFNYLIATLCSQITHNVSPLWKDIPKAMKKSVRNLHCDASSTIGPMETTPKNIRS